MNEQKQLRDWLAEEPFKLVLSAGFFGFYAHCGVLSVLEEEKLLPSSLSGSSAGALVAGLWAGGLSSALICETLFALERKDFWDPGFGLGLLKGKAFQRILEQLLPVSTFEACRVPLSLSVFDLIGRRTRSLKTGDLASSIRASCAVPMMFQPVIINGRPSFDGGVLDRPALNDVPDGERLLMHYLRLNQPLPTPSNSVVLVIKNLPKVSPFKLQRGKLAFEVAREFTQKILSQPIKNPLYYF